MASAFVKLPPRVAFAILAPIFSKARVVFLIVPSKCSLTCPNSHNIGAILMANMANFATIFKQNSSTGLSFSKDEHRSAKLS